MAFRWSKNTIEGSTIVESKQVDDAYSNFTSVVNGGFDRDNLPIDCIDSNSVLGQQCGKAQLLDNQYNPWDYNYIDSNYGTNFSDENTRGNRLLGLQYEQNPVNEGGSFLEMMNDTIDCEEGMLSIHFKVSTWIPMYWSYYKNFSSTKVNRKRVQFQLLVNGIIVSYTPAIYQSFFTTDHEVTIPISKGNQQISVRYKIPDKTNEESGQVVLQWWGAQLYSHNFFR